MMHIRTILAALTAVAATVASVLAAPPAAVQRQTLLIVSPRCFQKELQPFVEHKKQELSVESAALEDVLAQNQGVDDAEKLKHFLYQAWRQRHVHYVLLVGDSEVMPVRYMVLDRVEPAAFDYAFYPCDLYYADVAKADGSFDDWNAEGGFSRPVLRRSPRRKEQDRSDQLRRDSLPPAIGPRSLAGQHRRRGANDGRQIDRL